MNGSKRSLVLLIACLLAVLIYPAGTEAHFERMVTSSRTLSLGCALVSVSDDPSASLENPAGLAQIRTHAFLVSLVKPYGLSDLEESFFAAAVPLKIGVVGLSWHRVSLDDVMAEDLFTFAFGRDYIRTSLDASLSFGGSIDMARISYADPYSRSRTLVTGSFGVLLRPFPIIGIGYAVRNLGQRTFDLVPGGGGTPLSAVHAWGVSYHWERLSFLFERQRDQDRVWRNHMGLEVRVHSGLQMRSGVSKSDVTGGIGVLVSNIRVDVGVSSHEVMGWSYVVSVGYSVPGREAADEAKY